MFLRSLFGVLAHVCFWKISVAQLLVCGDAFYSPQKYTCYSGDFLCPIIDGVPTLQCGDACYSPLKYSCDPPSTLNTLDCSESSVSTFNISDPPYNNYFYSDCSVAAHVILSSPTTSSNLTIISPRMIVAFPAGNSGILTFFAPVSGKNGSLSLSLSSKLSPVYKSARVAANNSYPSVGVSGAISFNNTSYLRVAVLGGIRSIRDFTEGPSLLNPVVQDALKLQQTSTGWALSRRWLDNITEMTMEFTPTSSGNISTGRNAESALNTTLIFEAGEYNFSAYFNYPQLRQLPPSSLFSVEPSGSAAGRSDFAKQELIQSLSFLSYSQKLVAGTWRFLTYFGRDSIFSMLLLDPILSQAVWEAGLSALLERLKSWDGTGQVCHEEAIGDYAVYLNLQANLTTNLTEPFYDYKMIDTDFLLQIALAKYFVGNPTGPARADQFFNKTASISPNNTGISYQELAIMNAKHVIQLASPFTAEGNQTKENLVKLKSAEIVGNWRDSTYGLGGGIYPYDVNTALVPAALRSIAQLASGGYYGPSYQNWSMIADEMAQIWEDETLQLFQVNFNQSAARELVENYKNVSQFPGPSNSESIDSDVTFYAVALEGYNNLSKVAVMNSDDCFRHFLLNTTNDAQLTTFVNQTANNLLRTFPAGLLTSIGALVANPAYGSPAEVFATNFSTNAYHGTVVWSWNSMSMMSRGLELQLDRCSSAQRPAFCSDKSVYENVKKAYNTLWDTIEANVDILASEVWSWTYDNGFKFIPLGDLPPPPGTNPTEADIRQLWSLTFLSVSRNQLFR